MENNITRPSHYIFGRNYEPRRVIEDWGLDFYLGNVVKYISRAGRKGTGVDHIEDLEKAKQYLEWEIEKVTEEEYAKTWEEAWDKFKKEKNNECDSKV